MSNDEPNLKPCPFCGGRDLTYHDLWKCMSCKDCLGKGPPGHIARKFFGFKKMAEATEAEEGWNSRVGEGE